MPAMGEGLSESSRFVWKAPPGWRESTGSGMRLASFAVGSGSDTGLCTIVRLGANAGGLEANIVRWLGQLGIEEPADDVLREFAAAQPQVESSGGLKGVVVDLSSFGPQEPGSPSMMAAQLSSEDATLFIKLTAPRSVLAQQVEAFRALCASVSLEAP